MDTSIFTITSKADGLPLHSLLVRPDAAPKAIVQFSHGMCEHKERYLPFMQYLAGLGYLCIINDHRGHGRSIKSPDDLGYFYAGGAGALVLDLCQIAEWIREAYPALPLYLFGHSMGSLAARCFIKTHDRLIDGLFICGCPSDLALKEAGRRLVALFCRRRGGHYASKSLNRLFLNALNLRFSAEDSPHAWICSDPQVVAAFEADPLCNFAFTMNGYQALLDLMEETYSPDGWQVRKPDLPIWFLSGADDPCMGSRRALLSAVSLLQKVGYHKVSCRLYDGLRHELLNETAKDEVYADIAGQLAAWRGL